MIQGFEKHLTEAKKDTVVFAFGRMNPPTIGHGAVVDKVMSEASKRNADHFVFVSKTQDSKKNPLDQKKKVAYLKKFFPKGKFPIGKSTNPFDTVLYLCELGYKNIVVVTGSDHLAEYNKIKTYKGKVAQNDPKKRKYSFDNLEVVVAGEARDDAATGVAGMSASKMRAAAFNGDFKVFSQGVPGNDTNLKKQMYRDVRKGLNLKEHYINEAADGSEDKVTILALTSSESDLSDTVEKMEKICKSRKIEFYAVKTSKAQIDISNVASKKIVIKNYDGEGKDATIVPENTVCVVRGGVMNSDIGVAILTILQNNGVFMINERGGMELCANKLESAIALKKHDLPHPRTAFVANEENIETAVKEIGNKFPVIVKTLTGAEGIGVSKIESMESLKSVLQTLWKYGAEVIMQEFLPDFKNDVRSIVLNGKIFACAKRDKAPKDFRTNIARGSKGGSFQLSDEEIKLVEQAARVSKCYYVGIDHVVNDGKPYIIEMNASPGSGNIYYRYYEDGEGKDNVKGEELVEDFVEYILNKAHWKLFSNLAVREKVKIDGVEYTAKIDTGNSGYNMIHAEEIKDNGDHTVTFKLPNGKKVTKKIVSRITVKSGIGAKKRLVVMMDMDFHGKKYPNIKFSLGDRSHMSTKVLIGLQFLSKTGMVVDPSEAIYPQPGINSKRGTEEEEEEINELDVTKGKEFKTKTGKTKESPKDKGTGLPKKYVSGLSKREAELRKKRLEKRKKMRDDDPKTWEFVNPKEKKIKTKPSKYSTLYKKLEKSGKLKALKNQYEHDIAMEKLQTIDESEKSINDKIRSALVCEEKYMNQSLSEAASCVRGYIEHLKSERDIELKNDYPVMDINEDFEYFIAEVSPPSGAARRFSKKEKIKKEFQKRYGSRWKDVFYATAWKMHRGESFEPSQEWLEESKKINMKLQWTSLEKRGPLLIGTDKIVKTYKKDTPGERERLGEEKSPEEKDELHKKWRGLVNMSGKEIQSFLDSDEGKEAGLSRKEAGKAGTGGGKITSGRDSARAIIRMLDTPKEKWTPNDWRWASKQVSFISRMKGASGGLRDDKGRPTRKLLALKVWGYNPEKKS